MHKLKAFCLGLGLALMPFITLLMCGVVGAGLAKPCYFLLVLFKCGALRGVFFAPC